ncbi:MAG TPA: 6-pyruvoyl tetrahydropterin synthase family protein [Dehalococcoidia bacterium]|nr:6-pyruvoyl tetrahydropterin synthase family protein [Dehalococcoidia bacterium]
MSFRVTVERNTLRFAAAHFTTFRGECEPLHGHNYDVFVEVRGDLTADSWVIDFSELKQAAAAVCKRLDHKFLLQQQSRELAVTAAADSYEVAFGDLRYVIPARDVVALPIDNSTAERLAEWFARTLAGDLSSRGADNLREITVGIEEAPGQAGWFTLALPASA